MHSKHIQLRPSTKLSLLGLLVVLVSFICYKVGFLVQPLYWDEAWVYAPAVRAMFENGVSILPDTISTDLTRGHPLLFHFFSSSWMHIFGPSNYSLHVFALVIAVGMLIATYTIGTALGSRLLGLFATCMVAVHETFLAQSGILLPEILLALFVLLTIQFYIKRKALLFVLCATCALMTKESSIILMAALLLWTVPRSILQHSQHQKVEAKWLLICCAPVIIASLFFIYQKVTFGWYFFPEHVGMMNWDIDHATYMARFIYTDVLELQGVYWITLFFGIMAPFFWNKLGVRRSMIVAVCLFVAIGVLFVRWETTQPFTIVVPLVLLVIAAVMIIIPYFRAEPRRAEFFAIGSIFTVLFIGFSSVNFFTERYLLSLIPIIAIGMLMFIQTSLNSLRGLLFPMLAVIFIGIMAFNIPKDGRVLDTRLSYVDQITVNQEMVSYCENIGLTDTPISVSFVQLAYMKDPDAGYLSGPKFSKVTNSVNDDTEYAVLDNADPNTALTEGTLPGFDLIKRFEKNKMWIELHRRSIEPASTDL